MQRVASGRPPVRRRLIRWSPVLACGLLLAIGVGQAEQLAGWAGRLGGMVQTDGSSLNGGKPFTLRVAADSAADFMAAYGEGFEQKYPNAELQVIPPKRQGLNRTAAGQAWGDWFADQRPDVLELEADRTFAELAAEGRLQTLELLSRDEGWERGRMHPGVTATLRSLGGGGLYGIAPEYEQLALYYNSSLFEQYGIPLPRDGMTWGTLLETASRFAKARGTAEERTYGLAADGGLLLLEGLVRSAASGSLGMLDKEGRVSLRSGGWEKLWEQAVSAARSGAVYLPGQLHWRLTEGKGRCRWAVHLKRPRQRKHRRLTEGRRRCRWAAPLKWSRQRKLWRRTDRPPPGKAGQALWTEQPSLRARVNFRLRSRRLSGCSCRAGRLWR